MNRKGLTVGLILLLIGTSVIPSTAQDIEKPSLPTSSGKWLYVGGDGPGNYTRIQDAIDNSFDGDTVFVYSGTYYENVVVNKIIDLIGEDKNTTIIDGRGTGSVVYISLNGVTISGFTLQNSGSTFFDSGIRLQYSNNNTIMDNIISNNCRGIYLYSSSNNTITGNSANANNYTGIYLYSSSNNNIITSNNASNNYWGIMLCYSSNKNHIYHNNFMNNTKNALEELSSSTWDNGYPFGGNYWDDYTGVDSNDDGIGDTAYYYDMYPLMEPYGMTVLSLNFKGVKNIGNNTAFNVSWSITVKGGFIFVGRYSSGVVPEPLKPGQEITVGQNKFLMGFGNIEITYAVWADNAPMVSAKFTAKLILFFLII